MPKKRRSKARVQARQAEQQKTNALLQRLGYRKQPPATKTLLEPLLSQAERLAQPKLSDRVPAGVAAKRDKLTEHLWRRGAEEKPEAVKAAERKARRIGQGYHKSGFMYLTDDILSVRECLAAKK